MIRILAGLLLLIPAFAFAESCEIIFSLNDDVEVDLGELSDGWYELVVSLSLTEKQFESSLIKKGEVLYNGKGEEIGVALKDLSLESPYWGGGKRQNRLLLSRRKS